MSDHQSAKLERPSLFRKDLLTLRPPDRTVRLPLASWACASWRTLSLSKGQDFQVGAILCERRSTSACQRKSSNIPSRIRRR